MSYMRGKHHVWSDGRNINFKDRNDNYFTIPNIIMDQYVVMRFSEMPKSRIKKVEKLALRNYLGNFGCDGLAKKYGKPTAGDILHAELNK